MVKSMNTAQPAAETVPRGCTNLKLRQLTRRVSQHYDRIVGSAGLKTTQYSLLAYVIRLGPAGGRGRDPARAAVGRAKHVEAQRAWKKAQLALNARLGEARVVALHALLDDCLATINEKTEEAVDG